VPQNFEVPNSLTPEEQEIDDILARSICPALPALAQTRVTGLD